MAITAADILKYQSANMPEADTGTSGGAISTVGKLEEFVQATATIPKAASSSAADTTQTLTITGRLATGVIDSDVMTLTGTGQVTFTKSFAYILKAVLSAACAGIVTIYMNNGSTVIVAIPIGKTSNRRLFYDSVSGVAEKVLYEKEYWKNEHATLTLNVALLRLTADASTKVKIGVETAGDQSSTNRLTAPTGPTYVDDNVDIDITSLAAGASKGLWIQLTLAASDAAFVSNYTTRLSGTTVA